VKVQGTNYAYAAGEKLYSMVAEEHSSCGGSFMRSVWSKYKNTSSNNTPINKSCILCLV
jgi:hypothetical protein